MSINNIRSALSQIAGELADLEMEMRDLETDRVDRDDFEAMSEELHHLADGWLRSYYKNIDDTMSKQYADQLLSIVKKYQ